MNLLTVAPLIDSRGNTRYFIGAQVDVTGLCKDATGLEGLKKVLDRKKSAKPRDKTMSSNEDAVHVENVDEFQELTEMFNDEEMDVVRKCGGRMHQLQYEESGPTQALHRPRLHVRGPSSESKESRSTLLYNAMGRMKNSSLFQNVGFNLLRCVTLSKFDANI